MDLIVNLMSSDEIYMSRCLQLATNGRGWVSPNPMVGAVVVCDGVIIGEGFHREYGKPHAEVNAINNVVDKSLLSRSTIYVSLEPCSHYGKTPPCSQLIIDSKIPKVVIATLDPYHEVSGRGVRMLQEAGIEVKIGVLEQEAQGLNKEFFISQTQQRPYIYLKWAQTSDGFIDKKRLKGEPIEPTPISNNETKVLVHKLRAEVDAIMVATNTAMNDNPSLTTRLWFGENPTRVVLDRTARVPLEYSLFDNTVKTICFTEVERSKEADENVEFVNLSFDKNTLTNVLKHLNKCKINSVLVEGGATLLQSFIDMGAWDEAFVEVAHLNFGEGVVAPKISGDVLDRTSIKGSESLHFKNLENYKIL